MKFTGLSLFLHTGVQGETDSMTYAVTLRDRTIEVVCDADAFCHEKTMTTFYRTANLRRMVDCWATPLACFRTDEILMIRQGEPVGPEGLLAGEPVGLA